MSVGRGKCCNKNQVGNADSEIVGGGGGRKEDSGGIKRRSMELEEVPGWKAHVRKNDMQTGR